MSISAANSSVLACTDCRTTRIFRWSRVEGGDSNAMRCRSCYLKARAAAIQAGCVDCRTTKTSQWYRVKGGDSNAMRCHSCYQKARAAAIQASCVDCDTTQTYLWHPVKRSGSNAMRCNICYKKAKRTPNNTSKQSERKQASTVSTATAGITGVPRLTGKKRSATEELGRAANAAGSSSVSQNRSGGYSGNEMDPPPKRFQEITRSSDEEVDLGDLEKRLFHEMGRSLGLFNTLCRSVEMGQPGLLLSRASEASPLS